MKQLLLCRHAKSSWKDGSLADRDRPLNKRGKRDAPEMGRRLSRRGLLPDLIVTSHAKRARRTAKLLIEALAVDAEKIQLEPSLYGAEISTVLHCIQRLDDQYPTVMLVGHNPEFTMVANLLANLEIFNVPTCGIVALRFAVQSWQDVRPGQGTLDFFDFPKNIQS